MKLKYHIIIVVAIFLLGCSTTRKVELDTNSKSNLSKEMHEVGIIQMKLLGYEITDSTAFDKKSAENYIRFVKTGLNYTVVYDETRSAELRFNSDSTVVIRNVYNKLTNINTNIAYLPDTVLFSRNNFSIMMDKMQVSKEDSIAMVKMIEIKKESSKKIFGFVCSEVEIRYPDNNEKIYAIGYLTDKIPFITHGMGSMHNMFPGFPLETTFELSPGLFITVGAASHELVKTNSDYLNEDTSGFGELPDEDMKDLKRYILSD